MKSKGRHFSRLVSKTLLNGKAMARPAPRMFQVVNSTRLTPNMHRVTLGGEGFVGFPRDQRGGYIKFMLSKPKIGKAIVRTYTIRSQSEDGLDVDFALHGTAEGSGPATKWAYQCANWR